MTAPGLLVKKGLLQNCLNWFQSDFRQSIVSLVEGQFPNYALPGEIQSVLACWEQIRQLIEPEPSESVDLAALFKGTGCQGDRVSGDWVSGTKSGAWVAGVSWARCLEPNSQGNGPSVARGLPGHSIGSPGGQVGDLTSYPMSRPGEVDLALPGTPRHWRVT